jgi:hypothetical protein
MYTLTEQELRQMIEQIVLIVVPPTVTATLKKLGIPSENDWLWISQAEASRILGRGKSSAGRRKLEKGMRLGKIRWEKVNMDQRTGRVLVNLNDVRNLMRSAV